MPPRRASRAKLPDDPLWYKDAVIYETHVRAFLDSDGDGIGDFRGLRSRLDYIQELGVTAIWLLPFYPSPLRDDGYDIADYYAVHPRYGTLKDFEAFLQEAHARGIRVITELVVNHTSDEHAWFQRARRAPPGHRHRDFYVWSDTPERYADARIIFKDFEHSNWTYDPLAKAYYWHRFYSHQPDLNYDNPEVQRAVRKVLDFWLDLGVDGLRLDAVPYLFERDGTDCENLPETHAFLRDLRRHVDGKHANRMLLAEANQWPEDAAEYFGDGDECHMNFHFPLMPRLFMALRMEDRFPIIDILRQTPEIHETSQWALFLRNHDELTLEMVTDEERDYMYRVYAYDQRARINLGIRRRLAPLLGNDRRAIELMNGLLFSLPGTPVLYYGDELGMGDNIYLGDRNGVRTPMQWSADRNAGFSAANAQGLYLPINIDPEYHYETVNVEAQARNPSSLLSWMRGLIGLRKSYQAFGRGTIEFLDPENRKVLAFVRRLEDQVVLVVANLSRHVQFVRLPLREFAGRVPIEVFGRTPFPPLPEEPYLLTLGAHSFYWFELREPEGAAVRARGDAPLIGVPGAWHGIFETPQREDLEEVLPAYLCERRWFAGKARTIVAARVHEVLTPPGKSPPHRLVLVQVSYASGDPETYLVPMGYAAAPDEHTPPPEAVIARLLAHEGEDRETSGVLFDAATDPELGPRLLGAVERRRRFRGLEGEAAGARTRALRRLLDGHQPGPARPLGAEQSNTSLVLGGDRLIVKLYRKLQPGLNPEVEIGRFLSERRRFEHAPALGGSIEYVDARGEPTTLAVVQELVPNEGDAWSLALHQAESYLEAVAWSGDDPDELARAPGGLLGASAAEVPPRLIETGGPFLQSARLLGQRTAEMHVALCGEPDDPDFAPERFTTFTRRSVYQNIRTLTKQTFELLRGRLGHLEEPERAEARRVLRLEDDLLARLRGILNRSLASLRIRAHGDYHLGQVLSTGDDFAIIDFEGEPARPIGERRLKRSPLRDVAGMLRSFHYAILVALHEHVVPRVPDPEARARLGTWAEAWRLWVSAQFLGAYLESAGSAPFLRDAGREEVGALLSVYLAEKAVYELAYELANRPEWVRVPLLGVQQVWSEG